MSALHVIALVLCCTIPALFFGMAVGFRSAQMDQPADDPDMLINWPAGDHEVYFD